MKPPKNYINCNNNVAIKCVRVLLYYTAFTPHLRLQFLLHLSTLSDYFV